MNKKEKIEENNSMKITDFEEISRDIQNKSNSNQSLRIKLPFNQSK